MGDQRKIAIIYKSKYGSTKKYAQWIAEEVNGDLFDIRSIKNISSLDIYDTIIFGGGVYASGISGIKFIKNNINRLSGRKIIIFSVGLYPVREDNNKKIIEKNFKDDILGKINIFFLRGAFNYNKLNFLDRFVMDLLRKTLVNKDELTQDERDLLKSFNAPEDWIDKKNIKPIIECINL